MEAFFVIAGLVVVTCFLVVGFYSLIEPGNGKAAGVYGLGLVALISGFYLGCIIYSGISKTALDYGEYKIICCNHDAGRYVLSGSELTKFPATRLVYNFYLPAPTVTAVYVPPTDAKVNTLTVTGEKGVNKVITAYLPEAAKPLGGLSPPK